MKKLIILAILILLFAGGCTYHNPAVIQQLNNISINNSTNNSGHVTFNNTINASVENSSLSIQNKPSEIVTNKTEPQQNNYYKPKPGVSWQIQFSGNVNTSYNVSLYDIDLDESQSVINSLHNKGIKVICYISAGTVENYRNDANEFPKDVIGKTLGSWPDEKWLDISKYNEFATIMEKRFDNAKQKGCDGIEADNVQNYEENTGFNITYQSPYYKTVML